MSDFLDIHLRLTKDQCVELMQKSTKRVPANRDYEPFFSEVLGAKLKAATADAIESYSNREK